MKRFAKKMVLNISVAGMVLAGMSGPVLSQVCSNGTGEPPFLSYGVKSNLLMLLDNSGSMLDMAYQDKGGSLCFDETYMADETDPLVIDPDRVYVGNFKEDTWYEWTPGTAVGTVQTWSSGTCYQDGDLVMDNSILYEAYCASPNCVVGASNGCLSAGASMNEDNDNGGLVWGPYFEYDPWQLGQFYSAGDFVKYQNQLYVATSPGVSGGTSPLDDPVCKWRATDHTWMPNTAYNAGDIVTYKGMIFQAKNNFTSNNPLTDGTDGTLFDDRVGGAPAGALQWDRVDEGYFAEYTGIGTPCPAPSYTHSYTDGFITVTDMAITMTDSIGNKVTDVTDPDPNHKPANVTCFAATGNFLNWASASKFDIQKEILTGGKFHAGYEDKQLDPSDGSTWILDNSASPQTDTDDDRLVSEHRGCAGKGFTKQVTVHPSDATASDNNIKLTLRVRGSTIDDWIDTTDDATRIEILAVTQGGFDNADCQAVVDAIEAGSSFNSISNLISQCLAGSDNSERDALNHGLQYCEAFRDDKTRDLNTIVGDCESLYTDPTSPVSPATIEPENGAYMCAGVFDNDILHSDRQGYMGRCWGAASTPTCVQVPCPNGNPLPNYYQVGSDWYTCAADGFVYICSGNFNSNQKTCNKPWLPEYWDPITHVPCVPVGGTSAGWSDDIDGIPTDPAAVPPEDPDGTLSGTSLNAACHDGTAAEGVDCECIGQAMDDYCRDMAVPEVIDPSDQASSTIDYLSLPGNLIDAGIVSLLGENPLATMKAYSRYALPAAQHEDLPERPDGPRAILYENASALRIGVMAFMDNGSKAECDKLELLCTKTNGVDLDVCVIDPASDECAYCRLREPINKFCPETNSDGASVMSEIDIGMYTDSNGLEVWDHYNDVIEVINDTRATSWTPLAEAMYNALGYYGQKPDRCLGSPDGGVTCPDFPFVRDPIQYYCQENHILIITEGASTADINQTVANFATANGDGDADIGDCTTGLEGSTYLDDLTYFAHYGSAADLYAVPQLPLPPDTTPPQDKSNITTHIVTTGSLETGADECSPETIMTAAATNGGSPMGLLRGEDPETLEDSLKALFSDLRNRASAGSAASVISSARGGEGAIYQAIFWPELVRQDGSSNDHKVAWAGDVHGLFLDSRGYMFEDSNHDRRLDPLEDTTPAADVADKDKRVIIFFNGTISQACRGTTSIGAVTDDPATCSQNALRMEDAPDGSLRYICCNDTAVDMTDVEYLWSANDWLSQISPLVGGVPVNDDILENRDPYLTNELKRYIFTWNDLDNDGKVTSDEILDFDATPDPTDATITWDTLPYNAVNRGNVAKDFDLPNNVSVTRLVNWLRGRDDQQTEDTIIANESLDGGEDVLFPNGLLDLPLRSRIIPGESGTDDLITWRLGDIIHSTPMTVASPAEGYHLIYNDYSYAQFLRAYKGRRHVVYFGANDGMLHAVNAGFYSEQEKRFCLYPIDSNGSCTEPPVMDGDPIPTSYADAPALGAELWAYIPYNLLPHLDCLSDPDYIHKYYVDQRPRLFDAQIFPDDATHPNGWGTILVGGMRFGGAPTEAADLNGSVIDQRKFTSAWYILDITDPEQKPVLLGELTFKNDGSTVDLGYTTPIPTMAIMKYGVCSNLGISTKSTCLSSGFSWTEETDWYLLFGSGPADSDGLGDTPALKGVSDMNARVVVLPLDWLIPTSATGLQPLRISPDHPSVTGDNSGTYMLPSPNGFVSDMVTVDFDINPSYEEYKSDAVYFGTVEGNFGTYPDGKSYWNGGGKMYRIVTKELVSPPYAAWAGREYSAYGRGTTENVTYPSQWAIKPLIDLTVTVDDTENYAPPSSTSMRYPQPITAAPSVGTDGHNFWIYFGTGRFLDPDDKTDQQQQTYYGIKEPAVMIRDSGTGKQTRYLKWYETAVNPTGTNFTGNLGLTRVDDILVEENARIKEAPISCASTGGTDCLPGQIVGTPFLYNLDRYISGLGLTSGDIQIRNENGAILNDGGAAECWKHNGCSDGWYKDFALPYNNREKNVGQATLLGGLVTFTTYQPYSDVCKAEGEAWLYGVYYRTGTPWHENIFGTDGVNNNQVQDKVFLGRGQATTPNLHVSGNPAGSATAFVQTSTGEIREITQENLPVNNYQTGRSKWRQCN